MLLPDFSSHSNYQSFFHQFVELNKEKNSNFSYQYFSQKLEWPRSYLHDLTKGIKKLSVRRAVEFSQYFKLDRYETETLIYWCIIDPENENLTSHLRSIFSFREDENLIYTNDKTKVNLSRDINILATFALLKQQGKVLGPDRALAIMKNVPGMSESVYKSALNTLKSEGYINILNNNEVEILRPKIFVDHQGEVDNTIHVDFSKSFCNYCENPVKGSAAYQSFLMRIPEQNLSKVKMRLQDFRNWLMDQGVDDESKPDKSSSVYQVDLNLFPFFDKENK